MWKKLGISLVVLLAFLASISLIGPLFIDMEPGEPTICAHFRSLKTSIDSYYLDHKKMPSELEDLISNEKRAYADRLPVDPWGNPYLYLRGKDLEVYGEYAIISLGSDGRLGGTNEAQDVGSNGTFCGGI